MSSEKLRVLNEKGMATNEVVDRSEVHELGLWHSSIHVWIINEEREVLLQKRSAQKSQYANVWHISVAGHVPDGVTPLETALTEIYEEIGLQVSADELILSGIFPTSQVVPETGHQDREFVNVFLLLLTEKLFKLVLQKEEVEAIKLYPLSQFEEDIKDREKAEQYLNHPHEYYLNMIKLINEKLDLL